MWDKITVIMDTKNNFSEYRNALSQATQQNVPVVPFLGKYFIIINFFFLSNLSYFLIFIYFKL